VALTLEETTALDGLSRKLTMWAFDDARKNAYYEGMQRLEHIGLAVPPDLRRFETVVNWPRLAVDALEERLDLEGFRLDGAESDDVELWRIWQANDLDEESQLAHLDALIYGRSFICVGAGEDDDTPLVTVESPREMIAAFDPRTRAVSAALRLYGDTDENPEPQLATLYLPDRTRWLAKGSDGRWVEYDGDDHNLGVVPVIPLLNRRRVGRWTGVSELADIIPLTDAAARSLTNLQIAGETHSVPQKYVLGMSKGDFVDKDGQPLPAWQAYFNAIWATQKTDAKVGQFTASSLSNFHDTVNHYARLVASLTGLPPHYLGFTTDNPASADAISSSEARLVKRAERRQRIFGGSWEKAMRLVLRIATGDWVPEARGMEAIWRDPSTPTQAAKVDAIQKLTGGKPIMSVESAQEELGWNKTRRDVERTRLQAEAADPTLERMARELTAAADGAPVNG
jgi:hypothetical protein